MTTHTRHLLSEVEADLTAREQPEFPISAMTRAVFDAIVKTPAKEADSCKLAFDVGTGTGIHALAMRDVGYKPVIGIDVCTKAVECAFDRARSLRGQYRAAKLELDALEPSAAMNNELDLVFARASLDDIPEKLLGCCSLIAFNPPAFYPHEPPTAKIDDWNPVERGVYIDRLSDSAQDSLIYRFLHKVITSIPEGAHVICSWPGLERRVVTIAPEESNCESVHPARLMMQWFSGLDLDIDTNGVALTPSDFFCRTAEIGSYGLEEGRFYRNLKHGLSSRFYSPYYTSPSPRTRWKSMFAFGVMHLVRMQGDKLAFTMIDER